MKKVKQILSGAITLAMVCSMATAFNGVKAQAKENIPKYEANEGMAIEEACMYEDKALVCYQSGGINYYEGRFQKNNENVNQVGEKISKEEMYWHKNKDERFIYNFKDKTSFSTKSMEDNMKKIIKEKYSSDINILKIVKSENGVYWGEFGDEKIQKRGLVSSKGELIEVPFTNEHGAIEVKVKGNDVYALNLQDKTLSIITPTQTKSYKIDLKEKNIDWVDQLHVNDDGVYLLRSVSNGHPYKAKICKLNLKDEKGSLLEVAEYEDTYSKVSVDTNDKIWYLDNGLIYKIEDNKAAAKYEVDKENERLFVSDDNNFIASQTQQGDILSTIVNLSDKHTNGWVKENDKWSYYENRRCLADEWKQIDGKWYFFAYDGFMMTGWVDDTMHHWYYLNEDGSMATGWIKDNGNWYYLNDNGQAARRWKQIDGAWYYFNDNCQMVTGWEKVNGTWYYLNEDGSMKTGWAKVDGKWYYLNSDGSMAHDTTVDGYKLGHDGAMI